MHMPWAAHGVSLLFPGSPLPWRRDALTSVRAAKWKEEAHMDQAQYDRIAKLLYRISDSNERDEIVREIGKVLAASDAAFDVERFYREANVAYLEER